MTNVLRTDANHTEVSRRDDAVSVDGRHGASDRPCECVR
jgi:hypothetical protein